MNLWRVTAGLAMAGLTAGVVIGQTGPATEPEIKIIRVSVNKTEGVATFPGAFWNEMTASWIEVAFCGRPSDFLHETIISATTTRSIMVDALHQAGFHDGDFWVDNAADFGRLRGDRALILLDIEKNGKTETFPLDEMISFHAWNISVGPYGWMFKGNAAGGKPAASEPATMPGDGQKISDAMRILTDDPQIALQFRGLQHVSRSFMDYPLAYDEWVMPDFDYDRNMLIEPKVLMVPKGEPKDAVAGETAVAAHRRQLRAFWTSIYNSNGTMPVKIRIEKVTEEQFLTEEAKDWHDDAAAKAILGQLETAREIDRLKTEWLTLLPKVRKMAADARIVDPQKPISHSPEFMRMAVVAATIERDYATMNAAWATWAGEHAIIDEDPTFKDELKAQTDVWREHMTLQRERAAQNVIVEQALADETALKEKGDAPENRRAIQKVNGVELQARSRAMIAANKQAIDVWTYKKETLKEDDPRVEMRREIMVELALAKARAAAGDAGIAYGRALEAGDAAAIAGTEDGYRRAELVMTIAQLESQLADVDFEISKRDGMPDDPDLPGMVKQRDIWRGQLKAAQAATQPAQ